MLEDLEEALTGQHPRRYVNGQIRDANLQYLLAVGEAGLVPNVELSNELLKEELDWRPNVRLDPRFKAEVAAELHARLKRLRDVANTVLQRGVKLPDVDEEKRILDSLITYYEQEGHLNSPEASAKSLGYLKAAAYVWIRDLEKENRAEFSQRVKIQRSLRYFRVVEQFWIVEPYSRIALPKIIEDYVSLAGTPGEAPARKVAEPSINIGPLLKAIDQRLQERRAGAWLALNSDNPDGVSQAANSMVEVLDKVISAVCGNSKFEDVLKERFPDQEEFIVAQRTYVSKTKASLNSVKHSTTRQTRDLAEDLFHAAEGIIRTLLRPKGDGNS